jgi:hypothetical protein
MANLQYGSPFPYGIITKYKNDGIGYEPRPTFPPLQEAQVVTPPVSSLNDAVVIPFDGYAFEDQSITLSSTSYIFQFQWSTRGSYWTMNVYDISNTLLIAGIKISINKDLFSQYSRSSLPSGIIIPIDSSGSFDRIEDEDLGTRVNLIYAPYINAG